MKKIASVVLALCLLVPFSLTMSNQRADAATTVDESTDASTLTDQQIDKKLIQIDEKYEVGEALSEEDAEFIKEHVPLANDPDTTTGEVTPPGAITPQSVGFGAKHYKYNASKKAHGITVKVSGKSYVNALNPLNNKFTFDVTGKTNKGKVKVSWTHSAFRSWSSTFLARGGR